MWIDYPSEIRESPTEIAALERRHRGNGRLLARLQLLRLLKTGAARSLARAAPMIGYSRPHVTRWWRSYRDGGLTTLLEQRRPGGATERMTPDAWEGLNAELEAGRIATLEQARLYLWERWNVRYAKVSSVSSLFQRHGIKWKTGRRRHRKADAAAQTAFKKTSPTGSRKAAPRRCGRWTRDASG